MNQLFIVAGLPCSGKTSLLNKLISGKKLQLIDQLDLDMNKPWKIIYERKFKLDSPDEYLILHYDFKTHHNNYSYPLIDEILKKVRYVKILTLSVTKENLLFFNKRKILKIIMNLVLFRISFKRAKNRLKRFILIRKYYRSHSEPFIEYERWISYLESRKIQHVEFQYKM